MLVLANDPNELAKIKHFSTLKYNSVMLLEWQQKYKRGTFKLADHFLYQLRLAGFVWDLSGNAAG